MWAAAWETVWVTVVSSAIVAVLGLLLGLLLFETRNSQSPLVKALNWIVGVIVNVFRSIPFIILIVLLLNFTNVIVGTITGPVAAIPSLVFSAAPFYARMVEIAFREVDEGVLEAANAMGASRWQVIYKVLVPESMPALVSGITVTTISLIGYTAMAGAIGAGGLGQLAYTDGFQSYNNAITMAATVAIVIIVMVFQFIGDRIVKSIDKR
ncbi:ABC superfamily ATP binding cassette transporter, membrane protein [Ligilactobacillus equi DSM 15833 = JCM 10991]|uniref:ABC superfamily ATP binding cassette transporter, membrane protein n=1 Tax=Ligilactobacillus equi DSM 15833 = JCM 10991 TaxID=1423740 RepID=A0A0R1TKE9_9LACO|nr:ABC superfamily ATP binding cassette transporter, membrane protein [Ligilactobacillus equi DSM 15833 = JCM 10991]